MTLEEKIAKTQERIKAAKRAASFPKCVDCVFYNKTVKGRELCRQPLVASLGVDIHGNPTYNDISILNARSEKDLCGIEGELFVPMSWGEKLISKKNQIFGTIAAIIVLLIAIAILFGICYGAWAIFLAGGWLALVFSFLGLIFSVSMLRALIFMVFDS